MMKVFQVLLVALVASVAVGEEITNARLEVRSNASQCFHLVRVYYLLDMWWMTFEFASQSEGIHQ